MKLSRSVYLLTLILVMTIAVSASASISFTPDKFVIPNNGAYGVDFNHDGVKEFWIGSFFGPVYLCRRGFLGSANVSPVKNTSGVILAGVFAAAVPAGGSIGPSQSFAPTQTDLMRFNTCVHQVAGNWLNVTNHFLGLKFDIGGQLHYGWVELSITGGYASLTTTVGGFAYETIPGKAIIAGDTGGGTGATTVLVTSPANNSQVTSPVHYVASATTACTKGIAAMGIYTAPGVLTYTVNSDHLDTSLALSHGTYSTVVQAWDNCGNAGKAFINITVGTPVSTLPPPRFLYFGDSGNNVIYGYTIDPTTGTLKPTGQAPVAAIDPLGMTSDAGGYRLYATSAPAKKSGGLGAYFIDHRNGYLYPVPGSPFPTTLSPIYVVVHPSGQFVFVVQNDFNGNAGVDAFHVNADGSLSLVAGSPFPTQTGPATAIADPTGRYLYVSNSTSNTLDAFDVNPTSGALTPLSGSPYKVTIPGCANAGPWDLAEFSGNLLYSADTLSDTISGYQISSAGTLAELPGSPYLDSGGCTVSNVGNNPLTIAVDPNGKFLFAGNAGDQTISIYNINGNGSLTLFKNTPTLFGDYCSGVPVRVDPSGKFIYTFGQPGPPKGTCNAHAAPSELVGFSIDQSTGDLTPVPGSPFKVPQNTGTVDAPSWLTITP